MPTTPTKEELVARAQLVRVHEANCAVEHPTADQINFCVAIMKKLAEEFGLKELRSMVITGPATPDNTARPQAPARGK